VSERPVRSGQGQQATRSWALRAKSPRRRASRRRRGRGQGEVAIKRRRATAADRNGARSCRATVPASSRALARSGRTSRSASP
jgi:hypothetical protein